MRKLTKVLAAFLIAAMAITAFAACSKKADEPAQENNTPAVTTPEDTTTNTNTTPEDNDDDVVVDTPNVTPAESGALDPAVRPGLIAQAASLPAPKGQVIRGSTTDTNHYMWSGVWQNSASNADIAYLIGFGNYGGYPTVVWTKNDGFIINPIAVKSFDITENADGSKTFTYEIYDDLKWSDGTTITAKDYVGRHLLLLSAAIEEANGDNSGWDYVVGGEAYAEGETDVLAGVRLLGDYKFSTTMPADMLPDHYEFADGAAMSPIPLKQAFPALDVVDDGNGAKFTGGFDAEMVTDRLLDDNNGFALFAPVSAGPYKVESYDPVNKSAVLVADPLYIATYDGYKAQIQKIVFKQETQATIMDDLSTGGVDLVDGLVGADEINAGYDLVDAGGYDYNNYPRNGFGYIVFKCDRGVTQFLEVRQALGWLLDRAEFANQFASGYAMVVDSYFGASQPEYIARQDELEAKLTHYTLNPDKAIALLESNGWTLDKTGAAYGGTGPRYKQFTDAEIATFDDVTKSDLVNGNLLALHIEWMGSENNKVTEQINTMLLPEAAKAGIEIIMNQVDFTTLLTNYYRDGIPDSIYTMFNLAAGFTETNSYWYDFEITPNFLNEWNSSNIIDPDGLLRIAKLMQKTPPTENEAWMDLWVQLMVRYNELLPAMPLYSNEYHDFYNSKITGYDSSPVWDWARAIVRCGITG